MELINKNIVNNRHFKIVEKVIRDILHKRKKDTVYEAFKSHLIFLGESIMKNYLEKTGLIKDERFKKIRFSSGNLSGKILGSHYEGNIVIDEKVIEGLYNGKLDMLEAFFHELNHFKIYCDIEVGTTNICLYRILKEKLARESIDKHDRNYYDANYSLYSEEIYVEFLALMDFLKFIKLVDPKRFDSVFDELREATSTRLKDIINRWSNETRNLYRVINFNNDYVNINDIFDLQLRDNKKWLEEYPLLKIEYYIDESGNIVKRNIGELREVLKIETDNKRKEFICMLMLEKMNIEDYYPVIDHINNDDIKISHKKVKKMYKHLLI